MVKFIKIVVFSISVIFIILWFILSLDTQKNVYSNKKDLLKDNIISKGWIPSILPDSAYDIQETHNIDTNKFSGSFKYLEKDEIKFINHLKKEKNIFTWENFKFHIDTVNNSVEFF